METVFNAYIVNFLIAPEADEEDVSDVDVVEVDAHGVTGSRTSVHGSVGECANVVGQPFKLSIEFGKSGGKVCCKGETEYYG